MAVYNILLNIASQIFTIMAFKKKEEYDSQTTAELAVHYKEVLRLLGEDPEREGLLKTPERVAKSMQFLTQGYYMDGAEILRSAMFKEDYRQMVVVKDIELYSMCEHHLLPFYGKHAIGSRFFKEWSLRFGNAICCPAVTYHLSNLPGLRFDEEFTVNLDWAMWLTLAARRGTFVYLPERLMQHRISDAMETSSAIADRRRYREDQKIFDALWPRPIARLLMRFYAMNYERDGL